MVFHITPNVLFARRLLWLSSVQSNCQYSVGAVSVASVLNDSALLKMDNARKETFSTYQISTFCDFNFLCVQFCGFSVSKSVCMCVCV